MEAGDQVHRVGSLLHFYMGLGSTLMSGLHSKGFHLLSLWLAQQQTSTAFWRLKREGDQGALGMELGHGIA